MATAKPLFLGLRPVMLPMPLSMMGPLDIKHEGPVVGEVSAFRAWVVSPDLRLFSLVSQIEWLPNEAMSGDVDGVSTKMNVRTGVYALKKLDEVVRQIKSWFDHYLELRHHYKYHDFNPLGWVTGTVDLSGEVVYYDIGYRAQYARLTGLDRFYAREQSEPAYRDHVLAQLRHRYLPAKDADDAV